MGVSAVRVRRIAAIALVATVGFGAGIANAGGNHVKANNFNFKAKKITIQKGEKVTWKDVQGRHTVTFKTLNFDKTISNGNPKVSLKFHKRGTYRYYCRFHKSQGMKGKVVVK
jgi:plastocyanin